MYNKLFVKILAVFFTMLNKTLLNLQFIPLPFYQSIYKLIQKAVKPLSDYQGKNFCTKLLPNRFSIVTEVHVYKQSHSQIAIVQNINTTLLKKKTGTEKAFVLQLFALFLFSRY